jgi:phage anti-repressor protein
MIKKRKEMKKENVSKRENEVITIIADNGQKAVSAQELYNKLELDNSNFTRWANKNILKNSYAIKGEDWDFYFSSYTTKNKKGRPAKDYVLSMDFAKRLCMVSHSNRGEQIRKYFIEVEKKYYKQQDKEKQKQLRQQEQIQDINFNRLPCNQNLLFAIVGYARSINIKQLDNATASQLGKMASRICREREIETGTQQIGGLYGFVKTYPAFVCREVFNDYYKTALIQK